MDLSPARVALAVILAVAAALAVALGERRRGREAPGFEHLERRLLAVGALALSFFVALLLPLVAGPAAVEDVATLRLGDLLWSQLFLVVPIGLWLACGFAGSGRGGREVLASVGLDFEHPLTEVRWGLVLGALAWAAVLAVTAAAAALFAHLLGQAAVEELTAESGLIVWMAGQPVAGRLMLALGAGVVEETFFRGFLQPRVGITLSTTLFVTGHLAYGQPFLLLGVGCLSLLYAALARWRGGVLAAVVAHALFDAVQLLVVIPAALESTPVR